MGPCTTDLVGVATFNHASGPQLVVGFTPDRAQVAAAIDVLGLPSFFTRGTDPLRLVLSDTSPPPQTGAVGTARGPGEEARKERDAQVADALAKFSALTSRTDRSVEQPAVQNMTASRSPTPLG